MANSLKKKSKKQEADKIEDSTYARLRDLKAQFLADYRADSEWRKNAAEDGDFYDGKQLTEEEKNVLKDRGQPPVVINRIKPKMDGIFGIQQALRVDTKAYPAGEREEEVEEISEFFRNIEDDNDFDDSESLVFEDVGIQGRGWYEMGKRWEGFKSRHFVRRAFNTDIVRDRYSRLADLSDALRVHKTVMMDLDQAKQLFPDSAEKLEAVVNLGYQGDELESQDHERIRPDQYKSGKSLGLTQEDFVEFVDQKKKRVRVVTTYYRTTEPTRYYFHPNLPEPTDITKMDEKSIETLKATHPNGQELTQLDKKLHCSTFTWNCELETKENIRPYDPDAKFPFVMVPGYEERRTGIHYGLVRQMADPQREVNKRRSKLLHLLNVNQVRFEEGAFEDENKARAEFAKPDGWIKQHKDFQVVVDKNLDIGQSHFLLLQQATQEIDRSGVTQEVEGRTTASSGREYQLRQQTAVQGIRKLFSNLRSARRRVALYFLDEYLQEKPDAGVTKYDIIVEEAADSLNLNSETFSELVSLANNAKVPIPMDMLIEVSPLSKRVKDKFLKKMQEQQAQAAQQQALIAQMGQAQGAVG